MKTLSISEHLSLSQITDRDAPDLVKAIGTPEVVDMVLQVPYPYQLSDAISWIQFVEQQKQDYNQLINWAIRHQNVVVGGIGRHVKYGIDAHKDEIGYFLDKDFWNRGIMTQTLKTYVKHLFNTTSLVRLEAPVFVDNPASQAILKKCGFEEEGYMKKAYLKNGKYKDAVLFALVK